METNNRLFTSNPLTTPLTFEDWCAILEERAQHMREHDRMRRLPLTRLGEARLLHGAPADQSEYAFGCWKDYHGFSTDAPQLVVIGKPVESDENLTLTSPCLLPDAETAWHRTLSADACKLLHDSYTTWGFSRNGHWLILEITCEIVDGLYERAKVVRIEYADIASVLRRAAPLPYEVFRTQSGAFDDLIRSKKYLLNAAEEDAAPIMEQNTIMMGRVHVEIDAHIRAEKAGEPKVRLSIHVPITEASALSESVTV